MDVKRLSWVLVLFAAGIIAFALYARSQRGTPGQAAGEKPAELSASSRPATSPATRSAADRPASQPAPAPVPAKTVHRETRPAASSAPSTQAEQEATWASTTADEGKFVIGSVDPKTGYKFAVELINRGAAVYTVKLADHFGSVQDKQLFERDPARYDETLRKNPGKYKGHYSLLNPVSCEGKVYLPLATQSITVVLDGKTPTWALDKRTWQRVAYEPPDDSGDVQGISFAWKLQQIEPVARDVLRVVKTYEVRKGDYSIGMSLRVENLSGVPIGLKLNQYGPTGVPREETRGNDDRQAVYGYLKKQDDAVRHWLKPNGELGKMKLGERVVLSHRPDDPILWLGEINKFFGSMMHLFPPAEARKQGRLEAPGNKPRFYVVAIDEAPGSRTWLTGVMFQDIKLSKGGRVEMSFDVFAGPKKRRMFTDADAPNSKELYLQLGYINTIDLGACFCAWDWLTLGMMWLLETAHDYITFHNYGLAIILLVVLVRLALHPLTKKGQISMSKMQKLAPMMEELKKKYADDKETLQKETMKFYKTQGATPIMGCLPMFLQMPIWIALWTGLNAAVELRHAGLLPFWINDLAAPDKVFSWGTPLPLIGITSFHLLPILLTIAMFLQSKLSPQSMGASATPDQAKQQKMMRYMMPGMMLFIFYNAPSGLTLYIMASTFAGVAEQYVIRRHIRQKEELAAAMETTINAPGKPARAHRPKKPKGPFWVKKS